MPVLTPRDVRALLSEHGLRPRRSLGQNFLVDPNTARRIVRVAEVGPGDRVLEIGPGLGSLTLALAEAGARVLALEVDDRLLGPLRSVVADAPDVDVVAGDARTDDLAARVGDGPWSCVSNLPYNIATPVVVRILEEVPAITSMLVMVQREVGERLAAGPGRPGHGAVSVKVEYYATARVVGSVPPTVFVPKPKVESALVRLERRARPPVDVASPAALFDLVRAGFAQRRKTLRRALRGLLGSRTDDVLAAAGVSPSARAEELGLDAWAALTREAAT